MRDIGDVIRATEECSVDRGILPPRTLYVSPGSVEPWLAQIEAEEEAARAAAAQRPKVGPQPPTPDEEWAALQAAKAAADADDDTDDTDGDEGGGRAGTRSGDPAET